MRSAFLQVPDPRRAQSRRHSLSAMLTLIALGLLMGGRDMLNIWRKVATLDQRQRAAIGLRVRSKESSLLTMPGYDAFNDLMNALDPLHNKQDTLRVIVQKGGDHLVGTKANTSKRLERAEKALKGTPFLS